MTLSIKYKDLILLLNTNSSWKKFNKKLNNKPIIIDAMIILTKLTKNILLKENKFRFFKNKNNSIELNQEEIDVAIGIIIKPTLLK